VTSTRSTGGPYGGTTVVTAVNPNLALTVFR
jgi:hypothetical protein